MGARALSSCKQHCTSAGWPREGSSCQGLGCPLVPGQGGWGPEAGQSLALQGPGHWLAEGTMQNSGLGSSGPPSCSSPLLIAIGPQPAVSGCLLRSPETQALCLGWLHSIPHCKPWGIHCWPCPLLPLGCRSPHSVPWSTPMLALILPAFD